VRNRLFLAVVLAAIVIVIYEIFQPDGLALGYGIIAISLVLIASLLWSKMQRSKS
jgi:hypothetical protein